MKNILCFSLMIFVFAFSATGICQSINKNTSASEILSPKEVDQVLNKNLKKEFNIDFPVIRVYKCAHKSGVFYIILTESFDGKDEQDTLHKKIKALCILNINGKLEKKWEINDYTIKQKNDNGTETSIWFWTKYIELKDIDNDGLIDPILIYGSAGTNGVDDGRIKILIFYKGQKVAIRHQNGVLDDERNTQIDQAFYLLPIKLQNSVEDLMQKIMNDKNAIFPGYWKEAMKKHKLKLDYK